jgi:hypothetical protein
MREQVRIERQVRLENFLHKIETTPPPSHLVGRRTKTLIDLSLGYARAKDPDWPYSKITHKNLFSRSKDGFVHMYVHTPVQQRVAEALEALKNGNKKEAIKKLERLISDEGGKEIGSEIQATHRSKRTKNKPYHDLLDQAYKDDPSINDHRLLQKLKKEVGKGVIRSVDERNNKIYISGGGEFTITGLKDQLSDRRRII